MPSVEALVVGDGRHGPTSFALSGDCALSSPWLHDRVLLPRVDPTCSNISASASRRRGSEWQQLPLVAPTSTPYSFVALRLITVHVRLGACVTDFSRSAVMSLARVTGLHVDHRAIRHRLATAAAPNRQQCVVHACWHAAALALAALVVTYPPNDGSVVATLVATQARAPKRLECTASDAVPPGRQECRTVHLTERPALACPSASTSASLSSSLWRSPPAEQAHACPHQ
jgi:hypothetical protein